MKTSENNEDQLESTETEVPSEETNVIPVHEQMSAKIAVMTD